MIESICSLNLHPEKGFEGYPVKSTQIFVGYTLIFLGCHHALILLGYSLGFFSDLQVWNLAFFKLPPWKKLSRSYPRKIRARGHPRKIRVQIKRAIVSYCHVIAQYFDGTTLQNIDSDILNCRINKSDGFLGKWDKQVEFSNDLSTFVNIEKKIRG